ncbi:glycosyltransferase [Laribacter hongkongensis]|uniref:glycosyltransferase n=1 Tax=Laribacter hongkongensis TaxID=168471 RepID=UPI001EFC5689|nr:glycosyltransferase [Laribacter hongkongensis]MCG9082778.1 glycosyltransferase [Laribacter hongkongensis]
MRVLHVYRTYYPDPPGGLQEAIRQIAATSATYSIEPRVFALSPDPHPAEIDRPEARVIRCRSWVAPASCDLGSSAAFQRFAESVGWADVINYHFPWPFADLLHWIVRPTAPAVMTYHSDIVRQRWLGCAYAPLMQGMLRDMRAIVATSPPYADTSPVLADAAHRDRVRMIPLGIDEGSYPQHGDDVVLHKLGVDEGELFCLFIGVLRYYKGLHTLVQAAANVKAKVVIAGTGPEHAALQALVRQLGLQNVVFAGQVSDAEKVALLQRCRALVLPSHLRSEAYGMVLVEASMFGKPMVSCEIGTGTSFVNLHGETGFVVPPESPEALAHAMNALLDDGVLAEKFGRAARRRYEVLFSGHVLGKAYAQLYQDVLNK